MNLKSLLLVSSILIHLGCQGLINKNEFPIILQETPTQCGPICLKMVSQYYGKNVSIAELETLTKMDDDGTSLLDLEVAADSIGFESLSVQISYDEFIEAPLPAIVHWKGNHFLVVYKITTDSVFVADPGIGKVKYSISQFCKGWMNSEDRTLNNGISIIFAPKENLN